MLGVREKQVIPGKEFAVKWGSAQFKGMKFHEQFELENRSARPLAFVGDGIPIAYENRFHKGSAIIFGSFAGQENYEHPVEMHPLAGILAGWAGLSGPKIDAPVKLELRQMDAPKGRLVFFFNHGDKAAEIRFSRELEKPTIGIHEIVTGQRSHSRERIWI